jgi:hypothetical protein
MAERFPDQLMLKCAPGQESRLYLRADAFESDLYEASGRIRQALYRLDCMIAGRERPTLQGIRDELAQTNSEPLEDLVAKGRCPECGTLRGIWHKVGCSFRPHNAGP